MVMANPNPNQSGLIKFNDMSEKQQRKLSSKGGKASQKAQKQRKTLKEELLLLLETDNNQENMTIALLHQAMRGNVKAFETIRDTIGESVTNKLEVTQAPTINLKRPDK